VCVLGQRAVRVWAKQGLTADWSGLSSWITSSLNMTQTVQDAGRQIQTMPEVNGPFSAVE